MPEYLAVPESRRQRVLAEKARAQAAHRRAPLPWLRTYTEDLLDDPALFGEPLAVRFLDVALVHLAARSDWHVRYDPGWIGKRFGIRAQHVRPHLDRLLELGRFELVVRFDASPGAIQTALFGSTTDAPLTVAPGLGEDAAEPQRARRGPAEGESGSSSLAAEGDESAVSGPPGGPDARKMRVQSRAEQRSSRPKSRADVPGPPHARTRDPHANGPALPSDTDPEILRRIIGLACRGDQHSAAIVRREAHGLPEHLLARALESLLHRRPRPRSPAGYIVNALRSLRREHGIPALERATIDREPDL